MYNNIGRKIKGLAKAMFIVEVIGAVITGIALLATDDDFILAGLLTLFCGPIIAWVGSWILYAFGELVEDIHAIRNKEGTTEEKVKCEAEKRAKENAKREAEMRKKAFSTKPTVTKSVLPMNKPTNFQKNVDWQNDIAILSDDEIYIRYVDESEWSEIYRYHCYLELKKRGVQSIQITSQYNSEEQNELKILPNGKGYICPLCGFSNASFSSCAQCEYSPFETTDEKTYNSDDEYVDITCPKCGELLSFLKNETIGICPECNAKFEIK